jgi:hypothetical protein
MVPVTWPFELTLIKDQVGQRERESSQLSRVQYCTTTHPASVRIIFASIFFLSFSFLPLLPFCYSEAVRLRIEWEIVASVIPFVFTEELPFAYDLIR